MFKGLNPLPFKPFIVDDCYLFLTI